jgi:hypothetical protein
MQPMLEGNWLIQIADGETLTADIKKHKEYIDTAASVPLAFCHFPRLR